MITAVQSASGAESVTLLMGLRDMGNEVVRIEAAGMVDYRMECCDAVALVFPLPGVVQDCVDASLLLIGCQSKTFTTGLARSVYDHVTEVWLW